MLVSAIKIVFLKNNIQVKVNLVAGSGEESRNKNEQDGTLLQKILTRVDVNEKYKSAFLDLMNKL